jgi:opacity protein-like surface antigen
MKLSNKSCRTLGYFFAFFLSLPCFAAVEDPHSVGFLIGEAWPSGQIGGNIDGAVAPGLFYEYAASDVFSLYASGMKSNHDDGQLKLLSTDLGFRANLVYYDKLTPFVDFGMGLYFVNKIVGVANETASKTLFGMNLGLGADLDLSNRFFVGMMLSIHQMFSGATTLPVNGRTELSGRYAGFFLRGGVRF